MGFQRFGPGFGTIFSTIGDDMMNGYGMGFGGVWMILLVVIAVLVVFALAKYLRK